MRNRFGFAVHKQIFAITNTCEANYGQSKFDMISKFEIALKRCNRALTLQKKRRINLLPSLFHFFDAQSTNIGVNYLLAWNNIFGYKLTLFALRSDLLKRRFRLTTRH